MRLLLVEDDPVSRDFLREALIAGGHEVHACADAEAARRAVSSIPFDRLLLDLHLGTTRGDALLAELRRGTTQNASTPAIALTAGLDAPGRAALLAAGFACAAHKPIDCATLLALVEQPSPTAGTEPVPPTWDDAAALGTLGGRPDAMRTLRALLLQELPQQRRKIVEAVGVGDSATAGAELHRLRASSAFCGAAALGRAVRALGEVLGQGSTSPPALAAFEQACADLLASGSDSA